MSFKVVNAAHVPGLDMGEKLLEPLDATLVNGFWRTEDELISNTADADAVLCAAPLQPFTRRVLGELAKCRILASFGLAYDRVDLVAANDYGIVVTNTPGYCIDEVSDHAIALMLALGRKLFQLDKAVKERKARFVPFDRKAIEEIANPPVFRMRNQTVGIIGLGSIGTATALKAKGLGMRVIGHDPYILEGVLASRGIESVGLDILLKDSDFVIIHALVTEETRGMLGYEEFKKMKPTSYLINTSRGDILDQPALVRALQEGLIAGAGLDVTMDEPVAPDNPLLKMPSVILTGHSAWYSAVTDSGPEFWYMPMEQVILALKGEWPPYAVNPQAKDRWKEKWGKKS
jgi:D-3-phosphoglycerate dehydrogenase